MCLSINAPEGPSTLYSQGGFRKLGYHSWIPKASYLGVWKLPYTYPKPPLQLLLLKPYLIIVYLEPQRTTLEEFAVHFYKPAMS